MVSTDVIPPTKEGIEPVNELLSISRNTNFVKALKVSGIGPINLFNDSLKPLIESKLPNEGGIDPTRELSDNYNTRSDLNALIALGMVPERENVGQ